jgi:hypothetical protein
LPPGRREAPPDDKLLKPGGDHLLTPGQPLPLSGGVMYLTNAPLDLDGGRQADADEVSPSMIEAGVDALFASGLVEWNRPRLAARGAVEGILRASLCSRQSEKSTGECRPDS